MIEQIFHKDRLLAVIVPHTFRDPGIHFFTPPELSQQLAYMRHPTGKEIPPHLHSPVSRKVHFTQEVLFVRSGRLRVDFYDDERNYLQSRVLQGGDTILLAAGGHGFEVLEEVEMIEVKQGPYTGDQDKIRFSAARPLPLKDNNDSCQ
jgi:mannose-6-phosphate isomerase-like protein (cupin superfamily)